MTNRVRLTIDTDETIDRALRLRAVKEGVSTSEVVTDILRKALTAEIDEVSGQAPMAAVIQGVVDANQRAARAAGSSP